MTWTRAVSALEDLRGERPLCDEEFVAALTRLIPCDGVALNDLDVGAGRSHVVEVVPWPGPDSEDLPFWQHFWSSRACSYTETLDGPAASAPATATDFYSVREWRSTGMYAEVLRPVGVEWDLVLPLPAPRGISRRLVFFRGPGAGFGGQEKATARVLRPHLVQALREHSRREAAAGLTPRQRELLALCAQGLDNTRIARRAGLSAATVRKHLENAFARLGVTSRGEAVAVVLPDLAWA